MTDTAPVVERVTRRCPCRYSPRDAPGYRIVNRYTGQRAEAGDTDAMTVCSACGEEIEL